MHKIKEQSFSIFYAKVLLFFSIAFLISGFILNHYSLDPIQDFSPVGNEENTVTVTPFDEGDVSEVPPLEEDKPSEVIPPKQEEKPSGGNSSTSSSSGNSSSSGASSGNSSGGSSSNGTSGGNSSGGSSSNGTSGENSSSGSSQEIVTQARINDNLRNEIQTNYGIVVKYGSETTGYTVTTGGYHISTTPISNDATVYTALNNLKNALSLYPNGFFQEIKQGGIPLTIMLVNNYSENGVTGITDSSYTYATISIAVKYPFAESFYHESYHYIERYMFKSGAVFNDWDSLNPEDFVWGVAKAEYSYSNTKNPDSYFVNNYAQTSDAEDRASTFEYMMDSTRASCLAKDTPIWKKAKWMADNMDAVFDTVRPNVVEHWEQYLD